MTQPRAIKGTHVVAGIAVLTALITLIALVIDRRVPPGPPVIAALPPIELVDQDGQVFSTKKLIGRIWVANFVFTACPSICPKLSADMAGLQKRLAKLGPKAIHLVSFTVDPERDTPAVLKEYAARYGADARLWSFVTGPKADVERAVREGFMLPIDPAFGPDRSIIEISHASRFVLIDERGRMRALYDTNPADLDRLVSDIGVLAARSGVL